MGRVGKSKVQGCAKACGINLQVVTKSMSVWGSSGLSPTGVAEGGTSFSQVPMPVRWTCAVLGMKPFIMS